MNDGVQHRRQFAEQIEQLTTRFEKLDREMLVAVKTPMRGV